MTTRSPMIHSGGIRVPDVVKETHKSIFREPGQTYKPRVHLPTENPKYPESKHTTKKVVHNITAHPVTDRPGTESYDPVLLGGQSQVDHYPYATTTPKEVLVNPQTMNK